METERGPIRYELKNWAKWHHWSDKAFQSQFLKDLAAMAQGRRIKWVFSGEKMSREEIKQKIIKAVQDEKWWTKLDEIIETDKDGILSKVFRCEIKNAESLVKAMEDEKVFNTIFEVVE